MARQERPSLDLIALPRQMERAGGVYWCDAVDVVEFPMKWSSLGFVVLFSCTPVPVASVGDAPADADDSEAVDSGDKTPDSVAADTSNGMEHQR